MAYRVHCIVPIVPLAENEASQPNFKKSIPWLQQIVTRWCWAACIAMVAALRRIEREQCDAASRFLGEPCCEDPEGCNIGCPNDRITDAYTANGMSATVDPRKTLSFPDLGDLIRETGPVQISWKVGSFRGHVLLAVDALVVNGSEIVEVRDPYRGEGFLTYEELVTACGEGKWRSTWTQLG